MADNAPRSLTEEIRLYLEEAEQRIATLAPVDELRDQVAAADARLVPVRVAVRASKLPARENGRFVPGVVNTLDDATEHLIHPLSKVEQQKVRRLKRRYGGALPPDMHRHPDHATSIDAAQAVVDGGLSELQEIIYRAFVENGPMHDEALEELPEIVKLNLGKTTARRRRTDLWKMGRLIITGTAPNARGRLMNVYDVAPNIASSP